MLSGAKHLLASDAVPQEDQYVMIYCFCYSVTVASRCFAPLSMTDCYIRLRS
jgi:hypothetical protein